MLTFDNSVHSDGLVSCFIWADEPKMGRVRFCIGPRILEDVLHGENPVHDARNLVLCERNRERIEAACQRAFADRPGERIDLDRPTSTSDFAKPQQRPRPSVLASRDLEECARCPRSRAVGQCELHPSPCSRTSSGYED